MRKLKKIVAVLMLVFVMGLTAPQALAGDILGPGITGPQESPGIAGEISTPGITGEISFPGFLALLFGISWSG